MKLKLEEKDNKKFVGLFPSVLDEAERNIKTLESINIETIVSNDDEKRLVKANKKYIRNARILIKLGEEALNVLQSYRCEIDDNSAILFVLKGLAFYHFNLTQEADRAKKKVDGKKYFYRDKDNKLILVGYNNFDENVEVEDLSYRFNYGYTKDELEADTEQAMNMAMDGLAWISELLKTITDKKLPQKEIIKLKDIVNNGLFMGNTHEAIKAILRQSDIDDDYEVCQGLVDYYNAFLKKFYNDCWAFKVDNNL